MDTHKSSRLKKCKLLSFTSLLKILLSVDTWSNLAMLSISLSMMTSAILIENRAFSCFFFSWKRAKSKSFRCSQVGGKQKFFGNSPGKHHFTCLNLYTHFVKKLRVRRDRFHRGVVVLSPSCLTKNSPSHRACNRRFRRSRWTSPPFSLIPHI